MMSLLRRARTEIEDWLRYSPTIREPLANYYLTQDHFARLRTNMDVVWSLHRLASAGRLACRPATLDAVHRAVQQRLDQLDVKAIDWLQVIPDAARKQMFTAAILKPPVSPREKGVLYIAFEREWVKLLHYANPDELAREWIVVLAPSSSPHNVTNYIFPRAFPGTVVSQISNPEDQVELPRISSRFHVVPLYASSWMRPEAVQPVPHEQRDIDLLMVANFAKFKRHFALFQAMRHLPRSWRIHLIGQAQDGHTAETTRELAAAYGVGDRFTVQSDARHDEVARAFARSRLSLILSKREGSCVVVAESMFADTPVGVLEEAELGSRTFINSRTGRLLKEGNLAGQLIDFHARSAEYTPRTWAIENISCHRSIQVLNDFLRKLSLDQGQEWTQDILAMCRRPDPRLIHPEDWPKIAPARQALLTRWGLELGHDDSSLSATHDRA